MKRPPTSAVDARRRVEEAADVKEGPQDPGHHGRSRPRTRPTRLSVGSLGSARRKRTSSETERREPEEGSEREHRSADRFERGLDGVVAPRVPDEQRPAQRPAFAIPHASVDPAMARPSTPREPPPASRGPPVPGSSTSRSVSARPQPGNQAQVATHDARTPERHHGAGRRPRGAEPTAARPSGSSGSRRSPASAIRRRGCRAAARRARRAPGRRGRTPVRRCSGAGRCRPGPKPQADRDGDGDSARATRGRGPTRRGRPCVGRSSELRPRGRARGLRSHSDTWRAASSRRRPRELGAQRVEGDLVAQARPEALRGCAARRNGGGRSAGRRRAGCARAHGPEQAATASVEAATARPESRSARQGRAAAAGRRRGRRPRAWR